MSKVKYFIVETAKKVDGEWYKKQKTFSTVEEMNDYIIDNNCSRFTVIVAREVVTE